MKLHRTLVLAVIETLYKIMVEGRYADKAVEIVLKQNKSWGSRDRRFIAETIYEMVRWKRLLEKSMGIAATQSSEDIWNLFAGWLLINQNELPEWKEFSAIDINKVITNYESAQTIRKYRESIPDWLDELGVMELGELVWEKEISELNKESKVVLRVNTLKTTNIQLQQLLREQNVEVSLIGGYSDALVLLKRQNLRLLNEYQNGFFEIQDASSQLIAPFMNLKEGMTVIDACAGAGGKSLHMAAIMNNKGKILSMDIEEKKLIELKKRANRAGAGIIKTQIADSIAISNLKNTADRLLLDVPCSGSGVLRRNPDAKWKLNLDFIKQIKEKQKEILFSYSQMLKPGGEMVYATCSILPSENEVQVKQFIDSHQGKFELINQQKVMPSEGFDGFYLASIKRLP